MSNTTAYVTAGKPAVGGALFRAPKGTTLPDDATTDLGSDFTSLGYCSEDGLKNTNSGESTDIKAWGGDPVLNIMNGKSDTFNVTLIEALNPDVLATVYGEDNVDGTLSEGIEVDVTTDDYTEYVYVCDMIMKDGALKRIVIPDGKITAVGEIAYTDTSAVGYALTIAAFMVEIDDKRITHKEFIYKEEEEETTSTTSTTGTT